MKELHFYKMQGTGNDFVVVDNRNNTLSLDEIIEHTPQLCDRIFGIGADGFIALNAPELPDTDYTMIYRNADGSDAGMCGNGARCLARLAWQLGMGTSFTFNVHDAIYKASVNEENGLISICFPDTLQPKRLYIDDLNLLQIYPGTEHLVWQTDLDRLSNEEEITKLGRKIRNHPSVNPPGSNVNFVAINSEKHIHLQTYERGVEGLTQACGTGAIASALATDFLSSPEANEIRNIQVTVKGGILNVKFKRNESTGHYEDIELTGPAAVVYEGTFHL
jgi:diaminopimelate epimerase